MHKWLSNSAEVQSPRKANGVFLLLGCFNCSGRVAIHAGTREYVFVPPEYRKHMLPKKIPVHKLGLTQLQHLELTNKGATQSKLLSLLLEKC